jgi:4-hydroxy-3-polyprenylbenzoate decarboxylase
MAFDSLSDFIRTLEKRGELMRIREEVDPRLEIAALTDRVSKMPGGGKALLFERPKGHDVRSSPTPSVLISA